MESLCHHSHEELVATLQDQGRREEYALPSENYRVHWLPRFIGDSMVALGNTLYGKGPKYGKFKAIEVIARIPYQSWEVASYMLLTLFYSDQKKAVELSRTSRFSREAQDNETMHVIVMSALARKHGSDPVLLYTIIPLLFSFFYFVASFVLYLIRPKYSFQLNYVFECHAYSQYKEFLEENEEALKREPMTCEFLNDYGRYPRSEYEFFSGVMVDELIHRNQSFHEAEK